MAQVGSVYVSSVSYSIRPLNGIVDSDLTKPTGNGISFGLVGDEPRILDENQQPLYQITLTFNRAGVNSLSSIEVNPETNVKMFSVEFFTTTNTKQPVLTESNVPLSYNSTLNKDSLPSIVNFPPQVPSPLGGIRISILSTTDDQ